MSSDQSRSPLVQSTSLPSRPGRPVAPLPPLQRNIISNLGDDQTYPARPRTSGVVVQRPTAPPSSSSTMSAPSVPPLTALPPQPRSLHSGPNRTSPSPDTGDFELPLPPKGPLNYNITMGPQRQTSAGSEVSFIFARSATPATVHGAPLLLLADIPHTSLDLQPPTFTEDSQPSCTAPPVQPAYKPRIRKVHTKEVAPDNIEAVVALGMAPFMIGQDAMSNQNRLVRNETILTQHVWRLQRSQSQAESVHARREEDIYHILQEHKACINKITVANDAGVTASAARSSFALRTDPDFAALFEAHTDMHKRVDHLMADITASALSTKLTLESLDERIRQLASNISTQVPPTPTSTPVLAHDTPLPFPRFTQTIRSGASPECTHRKRKRDEWSGCVTPLRAGLISEHLPSPRRHSRGTNWVEMPRGNISVDVIYGPIPSPNRGGRGDSSSNYAYGDDDDDRDALLPSRIRMIANEALRDVGLSPRMIHSVRQAHDAPDFISIRFVKYDHAVRFVELVQIGRDGYSERHARLVKSPAWNMQEDLERVPSGSNATLWE